ncbi:sulfite exporter TauE/SafE family protein [Curvibacter sp. CHRR-16]|uniref:sulfite exporter TauE/SafE family protein n=1 Tax=Curvibacter sp. CHRR-16 TaxID=2835872 RepID=UPI001BDA97B4|nr:sulfite exporter TauE/SafE family protein [Curvibacter sp. CHRR-16]MBT0571072.1 sulfite exporter TauE/SafE family protein [Curvibacter sp. CHRR-16]
MLYLSLAFFGCIAGITTVLFGFGGGFVVVPLLYQALLISHGTESTVGQAAMHIAVATSTSVMVVSSLMATQRHYRAGNLRRNEIWPLAAFIGLGSMLGAYLASHSTGPTVRWAFVVYLGITIADCWLRRGFLAAHEHRATVSLPRVATVFGGTAIGAIATFLGVGGSVMTVPLLRRRGLSMSRATATANPLTTPVGLVGCASYMAAGLLLPSPLGAWYAGYVDLLAFAVLTLGSLCGVKLASPWIGRIPDRVHAQVYIGLLVLVLAVMLVH